MILVLSFSSGSKSFKPRAFTISLSVMSAPVSGRITTPAPTFAVLTFTLASFGYKHKEIKQKGDVIDEYELVTVKKLFNNEKEPDNEIKITYGMDF